MEANSAGEALEILRREDKVDLVLTDQAMPKMTGVQFAEAIHKEWPKLPVIIATGYAELPPESRTAFPLLTKSFDLHRLANAIARADATDQNPDRIVRFRPPSPKGS